MAQDELFWPVWRAAVLALAAAGAFAVFFQLTKLAAISAVSPFAEDPADAVGSIGVQVALAAALLGVARAVRPAGSAPPSPARARLAVHACVIVHLSIGATFAADLVATAAKPVSRPSVPAVLLFAGLGAVALLAGIGLGSLAKAARRLPAPGVPDPRAESLAEAISDLWSLALAVSAWLWPRLGRFGFSVRLAEKLGAAALRALGRSPLSPARHLWRFYVFAGTSAGLILGLANVVAGGPPADWRIVAAILAIFLGVEMTATLAAVLLLGRYLGIRPYGFSAR